MHYERIQVKTRNDYRGAQEPRNFFWREEPYEIAAIVDRWYEGYISSRRVPMRYFKVETTGGERFIIRYHELFDAWSLMVPQEDREA